MIPQETVNKILDAAQIEEVVGEFVTLKKKGANYMACCPFHNEKTASFSVSPNLGIYKCFGCGKSGTSVGFLMEHENMSYVEALKYLAKKYHIEVVEKEETAEEIAKKNRMESLLLVLEYACRFFQSNLETPEGKAIGYQYFKSRGLEDETIKKFGLGWAPTGSGSFLKVATEAGHKEEFLIDSGMCKKTESGKVVDRFFERVTFPIYSVSGRVLGFGARTLGTSQAKYLNSPSSDVYNKSRSLYGINLAKKEMSRQDKCILVEGYLDVISFHQLGITNVVASSGTALTLEQVRLIRKFTNNVTIIYDGDSAGINAALKGIGIVLKEGLNVKVVLLPDGMDPDDFAKSHTLEQVQEYISASEQDFISFKTNRLLSEAGNDPLKRANLINDIADTIALIPDAVVRAVYIRTCADKFEIDEQILADRAARSRKANIIAEREQMQRVNESEARRLESDIPPPPIPEYEVGGESYVPEGRQEQTNPDSVMAEPLLAPCEREILGFIIANGCSDLDFDRDSKYYIEGEKVNVAEFIDSLFASDDLTFENEPYKTIYDEYFLLYDQGLTQEQIQKRLLNNEDETISEVVRDILIDKYQITVKDYENSLTALSTRLVQFVPRALLVYQSKKVELALKGLMKELEEQSDEANQVKILTRISEYNKIRTHINNELGRV